MVPVRRLYVIGTALALLAVGCLIVAFARRHHIEDALGGDAAYFNSSYGPIVSGDVLDPIRLGNSYLWLGASIALAFAALSLAALARFGRG